MKQMVLRQQTSDVHVIAHSPAATAPHGAQEREKSESRNSHAREAQPSESVMV
jgi:hypothetical protein